MIERNFEEEYKQKCNEMSALKDSYEYAIAKLKAKYEDAEQCAIDFQNKNTELETEIEELKDDMALMREYYQQQLKDNTKQVCKKIIDIIDKKFNCCGYIEDIKFDEFKQRLLDQIEKGDAK